MAVPVGSRCHGAGGDHGQASPKDVLVAGSEDATVHVLDRPRDGQAARRNVRQDDIRSGRRRRRHHSGNRHGVNFWALNIVIVHCEEHQLAILAIHEVRAEVGGHNCGPIAPLQLVVSFRGIAHRRQAVQGSIQPKVPTAGAGADRVQGVICAGTLIQQDGIVTVEGCHRIIGKAGQSLQRCRRVRMHDHEGGSMRQRLSR